MADALDEVFSNLRGVAGYGVVSAVDDTGQAQTVSASTADGADRADVEVHQPFGFASNPPATAAIAVFVAVGADPANLVALPLACPAQRFGNLEPGEAVMYAADGTRVHLRAGGVIEIWGGTSITVNSPLVVINAPNGATVNGNLTVNGTLTVSEDITVAGKSVLDHIHPAPGGNTGTMIG